MGTNNSKQLNLGQVVLTIGDDKPVLQGHCLLDTIGSPLSKEEFQLMGETKIKESIRVNLLYNKSVQQVKISQDSSELPKGFVSYPDMPLYHSDTCQNRLYV